MPTDPTNQHKSFHPKIKLRQEPLSAIPRAPMITLHPCQPKNPKIAPSQARSTVKFFWNKLPERRCIYSTKQFF